MSCSIARRLYDTAVDGAVEHGAQEGDWIRNLAFGYWQKIGFNVK